MSVKKEAFWRRLSRNKARASLSSSTSGPDHGWTPVSLRRSTILALAGTSAIIAVVLGVLKLFSDHNDGICDAQSKDHYLWTYAPTAVFTVFGVLWTQVEYRAKQMQPWWSMSAREQKAEHGVLLDYVSPWNVHVLFKAAKKRHWIVVAAVAASLILQLLIILSTGLFSLSLVEVHSSDANLKMNNTFITDGKQFDANDIDELPVSLTVGILKNIIDSAAGTTDSAAFEQFSSSRRDQDALKSIEADVEVLSSTMQCENATVMFQADPDYVMPGPGWGNYTIYLMTGFHSASYGKCLFPNGGNGPYINDGDLYTHDFPNFPCSDGSDILNTAPTSPLLLWAGSEISNSGSRGSLCWPTYSRRRLSVTTDGLADNRISDSDGSASTHIPSFDAGALLDGLYTSLDAAKNMLSPEADLDGLAGLWAWVSMTNPEFSGTDFKNPAKYTAALQRNWETFSAQFFSLYFRRPAHNLVKGDLIAQHQRLVLRGVSFWLTEASLIVLFLLSLALGITRLSASIPLDPSSIAGLASILSASPQMMESLHETGVASEQQLKGILSSRRFEIASAVTGHAKPVASIIASAETQSDTDYAQLWRKGLKSRKIAWYRPFSSGLSFAIGVPLTLVALIITLEVLLHESQTGNGLASVMKPSSYQHYFWTLLPALTMTGMAALIRMQYDTARIFSPYVALSNGPRDAKTTINKRPMSDFTLYRSTRNGELYLVIPGVAVLIGWFLTIIVSGLYYAVPSSSSRQVSLQQSDWFNHNITESTTLPPQLPLQTELVLNGNASFPKFTYEELALTKPSQPQKDFVGELSLHKLPAIRSDMNCTLVPEEDIVNATILTAEQIKDRGDWVFLTGPASHQGIHVRVTNLAPCGDTQSCTTMVYVHHDNVTADLKIMAPVQGYFGGLIAGESLGDLSFGGGSLCPGYIGAIGEVDQQTVQSLTLFTCQPYASKVSVDVTFDYPSMEITPQDPPTIKDTSSDALTVRFGDMGVNHPLYIYQNYWEGSVYNPVPSILIDGTIRALVYGSRGVPLNELVGSQNRERFMSATNRMYSLAFAQMMDNLRVPTDASNESLVSGTLFKSGNHRLVQDAATTHVLACLLGVILVAVVATTFSIRTRRVLPKNPCSIAAVASLLVDSDFLSMVKPEFQHLSEQALVKKFDGNTFSMGWWTGHEGQLGGRRFGIDFGAAEDLR